MCERLRQFDLFRPIRGPVAMTNTDESFHMTTYEGWNSQILFGPSGFEIFANCLCNARIVLDVFTDHRSSGENGFLKHFVLLPEERVFDERMLRISCRKIRALRCGAQHERLGRSVQ